VPEVGRKDYAGMGHRLHSSLPSSFSRGRELSGTTIAKVQKWLGHANIATTRLYDRRKTCPEDSPTFKVRY
jgi:hypothetical protein